jgi:hypothetical protein
MGNTPKFHPLTGALLVPLGYRKNGRAIWPIMGASDDPPPADTPPADQPPSDPPADPAANPADDGKGGKDAILADLAKERDKRQELEQKFADAETARTKQMEAFAVALGLKPEDTPPDPAKLVEQVTAEQTKTAAAETRATSAERQLAVFKAALNPEVAGNPLALLDSTSFLASIAEIDPADETKLSEAITAAIEKNPLFKASPTSITPPFPGGPRTPAPTCAGSLGEAIANKMAAQNR